MDESQFVSSGYSPEESEVSRTLRNRCSTRGRSSKFRTPRTLTRQLQQHRDNERDRHRGLNASILETSKRIPGHNQLTKETKIVRLQRLINYICHLETHIQSLCYDLDIDLEFKNLFLTPHISEDTKKALARQTGYDPAMVRGYGDSGDTYIVQDTTDNFSSQPDESGVDYQVTLPCSNVYYSTESRKPSSSSAKQGDIGSKYGKIQRKLAESQRKLSARKRRKNSKCFAKKAVNEAKKTGGVSSETSEKETSDNEEQTHNDQDPSDFKPKHNWLDKVTKKTTKRGAATSAGPVFPEPETQELCDSSCESSHSPDSGPADQRQVTTSSSPSSSGSDCSSPALPSHTPVQQVASPTSRVTPTLTASQAKEGRALFHSYAAREKPLTVKTKTSSVKCPNKGSKARRQTCKEGEQLSAGSSHEPTQPSSGEENGGNSSDTETSSSSYSDDDDDDESVDSLPIQQNTEALKELNVVEMLDSDDEENCCSHGDPFLSSTVLSSQAVRGAQEALKTCLNRSVSKQRVYGEAPSRRMMKSTACEKAEDEDLNSMKENLPLVGSEGAASNNSSGMIIDKTPPKFHGAAANKRKNYTPSKIDRSGYNARSPLSPIGNILHLPEDDKPPIEISPVVNFSPSPAYGSTSLKLLLGLEEDPLFHIDTPEGDMIVRKQPRTGSPSCLQSQDSCLFSQDSGFVSNIG